MQFTAGLVKYIHTQEVLLLLFYRLHSLYYTVIHAHAIKSTTFWTIASTDILHSANEYLPDNIPFIGIHKSPSLFALQKLDLY